MAPPDDPSSDTTDAAPPEQRTNTAGAGGSNDTSSSEGPTDATQSDGRNDETGERDADGRLLTTPHPETTATDPLGGSPDRTDRDESIDSPLAFLRRVTWLIGSAAVVGAAVGTVGVGLALAGGWPTREALSTVFALGTLALGFGTLGWSGSILAGNGIAAAQRYMNTGTGWSERDSRRAMTRITGVGLGIVVALSVLEAVL